MNLKTIKQFALGAGVVAITSAWVAPANATLTLTAAGIADGFSLTTFATGMGPGGCCSGPFGIAVADNGNVLVSANGSFRYAFANVDGQTPGSALFTTGSNSATAAYARAGGEAYGWHDGRFVQFDGDGSVNHILTGVTPGPYLGMWGNPVNGHVIATSGAGLIDIDPLAAGGLGSFTVINAGIFGDGVTVSPDGLTAYVETGGAITPVNIATGIPGAPILFGGGPDGTGIIIGGVFNGNMIVNSNNGDINMYDFGSAVTTLIATGSDPGGADRGDYVAIDTKGCLFLAEGDRVDRLCLAGGAIGDPVPEPASLALFGLGLLGLFASRRRNL